MSDKIAVNIEGTNIVVSIDAEETVTLMEMTPDEAFILSVKLAQAARAIAKSVLVPPKKRSDA